MNNNTPDPVALAREVLNAEERHDGTPAHEADLREERWEFYEDLCTSNAPTLASTVLRMAALADETAGYAASLAAALNNGHTELEYKHDYFDSFARRLRTALNGDAR